MKTVALGLVVLLAAYFLYPFIQLGEIKRSSNERNDLLPDSVRPESYTIVLEPHWNNFTFSGTERIDVQILSSTTEITFHAYQLQILEASLHYPSTTVPVVLIPQKIIFNEEKKFVTLQFSSQLSVGTATLVLEFTGTINDQMSGFYRSQYKLPNGEVEYMLTTQMEPTDARRVFPCWDEPAIKATFELGFKIPAGISALSNMPPISAAMESKDKKLIKFDKTPKMSTYLVAFCLGKFEFLDNNADGTIVRVYTTPGKSEQGKFALQIATKSLEFYNEYFGIRYPLPKLDLIAIPDFAAGAMENWGLLTFRENLLLIDTTSSGISSRQKVAYVIAHEIAHQWFGNLVTMEWWKELWLNEGFATWVGSLAVAEFYPDWDIWTSFSSDYFSSAQSLDALLTTHPIEVEVYNSAEIDEIFDLISYCKGASVIRMIASYLGEAAFKEGLNKYLNAHLYGNAVTDDLWNALSASSGKDVKSFMDNWIKRPGLPVLTVRQNQDKPHELHIAQERFLSSGAKATEEQNSIWKCSIGVATEKSKEPVFVPFDKVEDTVEIPAELVDNAKAWIKVNAGQSGFFFVHYDAHMLENLIPAIKEKKLSSLDRIDLLSDAYSLTKAGRMRTSDLLRLVQGFSEETEYTVLSEVGSVLGSIYYIWENETCHDALKLFCSHIFAPTVQRLGWESKTSDSDLDRLLRVSAIRAAAKYGNQDVIDEALKRFHEGVESLDVDIRATVYRIAVKYGPAENYEKVLDIYRKTDLHSHRLQALSALGGTKDDALRQRTLEYSLSDEVRSQDLVYGIISVSDNLQGCEAAWNFLTSHWKEYNDKLAGSGYLLAASIKHAASGFMSESKALEVEKFFTENPTPKADRSIKQTLESIRSKAGWHERDAEDVVQFFAVVDHI